MIIKRYTDIHIDIYIILTVSLHGSPVVAGRFEALTDGDPGGHGGGGGTSTRIQRLPVVHGDEDTATGGGGGNAHHRPRFVSKEFAST